MITVRRATSSDLPAISMLAGHLDIPGFQKFPSVVNRLGDPYRWVEWFEEQNTHSNIRVFVAENDEREVIGFTRVHIGPTPNSTVMKQQTVGWMHELVMDPGPQELEVGSALLSAVDSWFLEKGIAQARATVWPIHEAAVKAFEMHGYRVMSHNLVRDLDRSGS